MDHPDIGHNRRLPWVLRVFWAASAGASVLALVRAWWGSRLGMDADEWNPLAGPWFADLMEYVPVFRLVHSAQFWAGVGGSRVAYPPFGAAIFAAVYATGHPIAVYLGILMATLATAVWGVRRALLARGIGYWPALLLPLTVVATSFPIWGMLQRGNLELIVWVFCAVGIWAWWQERDDVAGGLWGLAAGVKLYPLVLLVLLLPRGRWRAFAFGIATFVGVSTASMAWLGPSLIVAWHGSIANVFGYQGVRAGEWTMHELAANHSAFGLVKVMAVGFGWRAAGLVPAYYAVGGAAFAAAFFGRLRRMPRANQLLAVSVFMVALPPVSYFYSLVHLYVAWVVLVLVALRAEHAGVRVHGLRAAVLMLVPLFASFTLLTWRGVWMFGGLVQASLLVTIFACASLFPFIRSDKNARNAATAIAMFPAMRDSKRRLKNFNGWCLMPSLPFSCDSLPLSVAGFQSAVATLGIDAPTLWSMLEVETQGFGCLKDRRPQILYERHIFSRLTGGKFDDSNPDISNPVAGGYGAGGAAQYARLSEAVSCDSNAALQSASWGLGQVLGSNFAALGYASVEDMVTSMCASEDGQLSAVVAFILANKLAKFLQARDWTSYALHYNGQNYAKNSYDTRLAASYTKFSDGPLPDVDVRVAQACLEFLNYSPGGIDGVLGGHTLTALHNFQTKSGVPLTVGIDNGVVATLLAALPPAVDLFMP